MAAILQTLSGNPLSTPIGQKIGMFTINLSVKLQLIWF